MIGARGRSLRYAAIILLGFGVDYLLALALVRVAGLGLAAAAAAGFGAGLVLNYALFELWAFRSDRVGFSWARFGGTAGIALLALGVRLGVVTLLSALARDPVALAPGIFIAAAAASALVNYVLVNRLFRGRSEPQGRAP